jgi:hypothetical protein
MLDDHARPVIWGKDVQYGVPLSEPTRKNDNR